MTDFDDLIAPPESSMAGHWHAIIATSAGALTDTVMVTIPEYSVDFQWGPCRWMPRGNSVTFPTRGDEALVIFDNNRYPWIVAWWPF